MMSRRPVRISSVLCLRWPLIGHHHCRPGGARMAHQSLICHQTVPADTRQAVPLVASNSREIESGMATNEAEAPKMETGYLGRATGMKVSKICLGCMTFGSTPRIPGGVSEEHAYRLLDDFVSCGGNFIDTADIYHMGQSERMVGNWMEARGGRDRIVLATKARFPFDLTDPNAVGLSRKHIMSSSLERLKTPFIDLFQMHTWDDGTPIEETLGAVSDLIRAGKILYFGVSNVTGWQMQKIVDLGRTMGVPLVSNQVQYSLLSRTIEWEQQQVCVNEGVGIMPWSPLKGGVLAGKYERTKQPPSDSRVAWADRNNSQFEWSHFAEDEMTWNLLDGMKAIAAETERSVAQVALRWLLQKPAVTSLVIGITSVAQLRDNMGVCGWELTPEQMKKLDTLSQVKLPYPYNFIQGAQGSRTPGPWP